MKLWWVSSVEQSGPRKLVAHPHLSSGNQSYVANCPEYDRLHSEVESVLGNLAQVTTMLLELFRSGDSQKYTRLDKELELTVGETERAIGALASTFASTSANLRIEDRRLGANCTVLLIEEITSCRVPDRRALALHGRSSFLISLFFRRRRRMPLYAARED